MAYSRLPLARVTGAAGPIFTGRGCAEKLTFGVCPGEEIVVIDFALIGVWRVIGNAFFIRQVVDNGWIGIDGPVIEQFALVVRDQPADSVIPGALADSIDCIDLLAVFTRDGAQKRAPLLFPGPRHAFIRNRRTDFISSAQPCPRARFAITEVAAKTLLTPGQFLHCLEARHEETKMVAPTPAAAG